MYVCACVCVCVCVRMAGVSLSAHHRPFSCTNLVIAKKLPTKRKQRGNRAHNWLRRSNSSNLPCQILHPPEIQADARGFLHSFVRTDNSCQAHVPFFFCKASPLVSVLIPSAGKHAERVAQRALPTRACVS